MKNTKEFPFEKARRVTPRELAAARKAIEEKTGVLRQTRGRPPKADAEKYQPTTIRLHPKVLAWARREARKRRVGYQTIINEALLQRAL
ncbi:MAG: BrnA antitoxin family protein [Acidobacteriia bacterium]|nr:BrnA antitoxin family protein [Terriglobia bacterium]